MSNSARDIQTSIDRLYKVKAKYRPGSMKYMNISIEIYNLKNKRKEMLNGNECT